MELKTSTSGGKYYSQQPENTRVAKMEDFYDSRGNLILDKPYLIKSEINDHHFWANRVKSGFPFPGSDFDLFLSRGRIYVFTNTEKP